MNTAADWIRIIIIRCGILNCIRVQFEMIHFIELSTECGADAIGLFHVLKSNLGRQYPYQNRYLNYICSDDHLFNNLILERLLIAHMQKLQVSNSFDRAKAYWCSFDVYNIRFATVTAHRIRLASDWATFGVLKHRNKHDIKNQSNMIRNWKLIGRIKFFVPWKMDEKWRMCVFRRISRASITKRNEINNYYNLDLVVERNETLLMNGRCSMLILITPEIKPRDDQKRCEKYARLIQPMAPVMIYRLGENKMENMHLLTASILFVLMRRDWKRRRSQELRNCVLFYL